MTKMFEEYWRGEVSGAVEYFKSQPARGEFTLVVEGKPKETKTKWTEEELKKVIQNEMKRGKSARDISASFAEVSGWKKKEIYELVNRGK